jgi:hypothetical protein
MTQPTITLPPQVRGSDLPEIPLSLIAGDQPTIARDCYVVGIEQHGTLAPWGWRFGHHENIDHHAPVDAMARVVSSANLALLRIASEGPVTPAARVLITHNDCDSILSSGIMAGRLAPDPKYGAAAIAADHTGAPDAIADLLQAIQDRREVDFAFEMLARLESGRQLPAEAQRMLDARLRKREQASEDVAQGVFSHLGHGVYFAELNEETDGEFFPALLPHAELIVIGIPHPDPVRAKRWAVKVRRGLAMPEGRDLRHLLMKQYDPAFGGRWNAGSNKRGGGTDTPPRAWAEGLVAAAGLSSPLRSG